MLITASGRQGQCPLYGGCPLCEGYPLLSAGAAFTLTALRLRVAKESGRVGRVLIAALVRVRYAEVARLRARSTCSSPAPVHLDLVPELVLINRFHTVTPWLSSCCRESVRYTEVGLLDATLHESSV